MRIGLNLATRPYADLGPAMKRLRIAMGALAAVCLALTLGLHAVHNKAEEARAREHSLDGQIARVNQERQGYQNLMQQPENAHLLKAAQTLNPIFDQKAFSWTLAMENLETVLPGGVQVTTLEPVRAKEGYITLHMRVAGPRDLGEDLVRNLEHSRRFLQPRIVGETAETAGNGPNQRLEPVSGSNRFSFDLLAEYNPPTPEERKAEKPTSENQAPGVVAAPAVNAPGNTQAPAHRAPQTNVPPKPAPAQPRPAQPRPAQPPPAQPIPGRLRNPFQTPPPGGQQ